MKATSKISGKIPTKALEAQAQSSDPNTSVWVSANAGSGKTHVLTERVIRILLTGTPPSRILCLTYTKAAAAVMQTRIFSRLSQWTRISDEELGEALQKLEHKKPDTLRITAARKLFAHALETPGGLKIQTIHAFCEALLHQFPVEANIAGHFEMIDDMRQIALIGEAKRLILETAYKRDDEELSQAFDLILSTVGEFGLDRLLSEAIYKRQSLSEPLLRWREQGIEFFRRIFGVKASDNPENLSYALKEAALYSPDRIALFLSAGGSNMEKFCDRIEALATEANWRNFKDLAHDIYFTGQGKARSPKTIFTKAVQAVAPDAIDEFGEKHDHVLQLIDAICAVDLVGLNQAAYVLVDALNSLYNRLKKRRGFLDFDDLIHKTVAMLKRKGAGEWVQYKLDRGIDHILVDEAQDTSPAQWQIIRLLSEEFFSGTTARNERRTLFAVGDEKQSIYSFQGAIPEDFAQNGRAVEKRALAAKLGFKKLRLDFSFRSTADVLNAVDHVFEHPQNYQGLSAENEKTIHEPVRKDEPGEVDVWEALTPDEVSEPEDWREPVDQLAAPAIKLARQMALTIKHWLDNGEVIAGKNRLITPRDIMVLVRKRDQFVHALSRELKNLHIAVAGADRLRLADHIAVRDLVALGRFVLQPYDDLSLAAVLKSPIFGLNENDLLKIAAERSDLLYRALEQQAGNDPKYQRAYDLLEELRALADITPVYEFYSRILSEHHGRRDILARLGNEASDVLDAFMDYTLAVQKTGLPGLQAFLETLAEAQPEIKREMDQSRNEVRIMTVHAAKGLEAAVVFLVDSGSRIWNSQHEPKLIEVDSTAKGQTIEPVLLWQPSSDYKTALIGEAIDGLKQRAAEEYRRLLYVGMTRAEDRLIVCGYKSNRPTTGTWLDLVKDALQNEMVEISSPVDGITAYRYQITPPQLGMYNKEKVVEEVIQHFDMPDYLLQRAPAEQGLPRPLSPSKASILIEDAPNIDPHGMSISPIFQKTEQSQLPTSLERGTLIHTLLQYLPDVAEDKRRALTQNYLAKQAGHFDEKSRQQMQKMIFDVLDNPQFKLLFSKQSQAEVALMGVVDVRGKQRPVSGQIDRLVVDDAHVLFADFKTGQVPESMNEVPDGYILQMALYRKLLGEIYPNKQFKGLLIYTNGPVVFEMNETQMRNMVESL